MNEVNEIYSDGIGKINFLGGMIRLDLFSFMPTDNKEEKPEPRVVQRVVMSPNAFLASYESFVNMIDKLQDAGIIAKAADTQDGGEGSPAPTEGIKIDSIDTEGSSSNN